MALLQETLRSLHARDLQHGSKQASLFAVGIAFIIITLFVVSLRIYVRTRLLGLRMATDDCEFGNLHDFYRLLQC